jgi:hypothetical protein
MKGNHDLIADGGRRRVFRRTTHGAMTIGQLDAAGFAAHELDDTGAGFDLVRVAHGDGQ